MFFKDRLILAENYRQWLKDTKDSGTMIMDSHENMLSYLDSIGHLVDPEQQTEDLNREKEQAYMKGWQDGRINLMVNIIKKVVKGAD